MATLDVTDVRAISFSANTTVTAPVGGTFPAIADLVYGVPDGVTAMTVSSTGKVMCQTKGTYSPRNNNVFQMFTVDEVRTPV